MKNKKLSSEIKQLERKVSEQQKEIDELNKRLKRSRFWLFYLLWKKDK